MKPRQIVVLIVAVAVLAGGVGAAVAMLAGGGPDAKNGERAVATPQARTFQVTPEQASDDLSSGLMMEIGGSQWSVNSVRCDPAGQARFRCPSYIQGGWSGGGGGTLPDEGVAGRYGLDLTQGGQKLDFILSYSEDGEQLTWSPGGGSALVADVRARQRAIDEAVAENQRSAPESSDPVESDAPGASAPAPPPKFTEDDEQDCGRLDVQGVAYDVTGAGLNCDTIRDYFGTYATAGDVPDGWDPAMCGVSSLSCEDGDAYFRGDPS